MAFVVESGGQYLICEGFRRQGDAKYVPTSKSWTTNKAEATTFNNRTTADDAAENAGGAVKDA